MSKRIAMLAGVLTVVSMCSSVVLALPPMGPPKAMVGTDEWVVGVGFSHSNMDLETWGDVRNDPDVGPTIDDYTSFEIDGLESNMVLGCLSYGVHDNWDAFVCLGASDAADDIIEDPASGSGDRYTGLDGSLGFAWGFGTRVTFWDDGDVTWGGLFQTTWSDPDESDIRLQGDSTFTGDADLDFWQVQVAIGPTVEIDNVSVYGGPFLHFVGGDLDIDGRSTASATNVTISQEIREQSHIGGYVGAQWFVNDNTCAHVEVQFTGDAWAAGVGAVWRTE
ncbi:MAG: hypothetical protein JSW59_20240 [Phycisphaerales bacterium]|nr:MAG: hypothetical protein JSW59_20240 [Phycisphaerales bacterium]